MSIWMGSGFAVVITSYGYWWTASIIWQGWDSMDTISLVGPGGTWWPTSLPGTWSWLSTSGILRLDGMPWPPIGWGGNEYTSNKLCASFILTFSLSPPPSSAPSLHHIILYRCVYERSPISPTLVTYTLSAVWHGFYPGYYFTFIFFGIETEAARKVLYS